MASTNSPLFAGLPPLPQVPGTEPERIALDAFRIAIADQVARSLNLDIAKVYEGVQYGAKGADCNLAIPRFRLKEDAKALAQKVASEVSPIFTYAYASHVLQWTNLDFAQCLCLLLSTVRAQRVHRFC